MDFSSKLRELAGQLCSIADEADEPREWKVFFMSCGRICRTETYRTEKEARRRFESLQTRSDTMESWTETIIVGRSKGREAPCLHAC